MALTYKKSGVDIDKGNKLVDIIKPLARSTFKPHVMTDIGSFGAFCKLDTKRFKDPVLVSGTDGVGTKLKIAFMMNKHDTVGIDLVAMCVNDILTSGAQPLFFLDYFASGKLSTKQAADVIKGIAKGCIMADCSLIGGETAEMPGFYDKGEYDLSGFSVGAVSEKEIINGSKIKNGDVLIGLASSGIHSNGFSLVRKLFFDIKKYSHKKKIKEFGCTLGEELLKPTKIYVKSVMKIIKDYKVNGIAHITGGGLTENLPRIIPSKAKLKFVIEKGSWPILPVFELMKDLGKVPEAEMLKTFNMGIGMVLIVKRSDAPAVIKKLKRLKEDAYVIGYVENGKRGLEYK
ncbi:phosphoribosylformylglycinamidine cyclo-ligase [bacterium BMS3Abin09]|nr:phosphoribosylformylglycinamidine cyclo-ligase [bacterium BMS3Abin09]GBE41683.1 phosphoribosylformylglycinamidine cyclo-ligase [bacterium BMS3Bbin09]